MKKGRTEIRKRARFTLQQLAARTGISRTRLSQWERYEGRLRDIEIASVAAALIDGLDRGPKFEDVESIESFLEGAE